MDSENTAPPASFRLHSVEIVDTFAEAFPIKAARLIITADELRWAETAANSTLR